MKKVLIAEDSKTLTKALKYGLKPYAEEFDVVFVENGLEAMNVLGAEPIDLVVTDIHMPMVDGLVLLAYMLENCPHTGCIIMSSYGDGSLKEELRENILYFIDKPVDSAKLARLIRDTLKENSGSRRMKNIAMVDLMSMIMVGKKTCVFQLNASDGTQGLFYFQNGELFNVVQGSLKGADAFKAMLNWPSAEIRFLKAPAKKGRKELPQSMPELIKMAESAKLKIKAAPKS